MSEPKKRKIKKKLNRHYEIANKIMQHQIKKKKRKTVGQEIKKE